MTREELMKRLAANPRFRMAPESGKAFIIGGAKRMNTTEATPNPSPESLTPEEQEIIEWLERSYGRKLTPQEVYLSLAQARAIGSLPQAGHDDWRRIEVTGPTQKPK